MKLWLAGVTDRDAQILDGLEGVCRLVSYHYHVAPGEASTISWAVERGVPLFLDSGAWSAWTQGARIDLAQYTRHCKRHQDRYEVVAALDVIGDPEGTLANWEHMQGEGVDCIPTFHVGEDWAALDRLAQATDFLAFGNMVGTPPNRLRAWIAHAFQRALRVNPEVRVHGFGQTSTDMMAAFPWVSVDSTTWLVSVRFARVILRQGMRLRIVSREEYEQDPTVLGKLMGLTPSRSGGSTEKYDRIARHNARAMIAWVRDLDRGRALLESMEAS